MKTIYAYIAGFIASIALTSISFGIVLQYQDRPGAVGFAGLVVVLCAIAQIIAQLVWFLHLGSESRPRWRLITFWYALFLVVVLCGGSIWIMRHLHHEAGMVHQPPAYYDRGF